jgi:CO/xanthine dehydrogenase Mo-binding subunit
MPHSASDHVRHLLERPSALSEIGDCAQPVATGAGGSSGIAVYHATGRRVRSLHITLDQLVCLAPDA